MAVSKGRPDIGVGLGRVAGGESPESESETRITPAKLRTGHDPSPEAKCALQYAPSRNSANLCQSEVVNVKDAPNNQCEEACAWTSFHE